MTQIKSYPANTVVGCPECKEHSRLPHDIHHNDTPLFLCCPSCENKILWRTLPVLPKVRLGAGLELKYFEISRDTERRESTEEAALKSLVDEDRPVVPFWQLATDLGENLQIMVQQIEYIKKEIDQFANQMIPWFQSEYQYATEFKESYRPSYMGEFLKHPIAAIPINCTDELAANYARWIVSPKFYDPCLGIKVRSYGGMRLELMNQYTRISNTNLNHKLCQELGLPPTLDLRVRGNKIIGGSLPSCWNDIPGIAEDKDSTDEWQSVYIRDSFVARQWLAKHGIPPWEPQPFAVENLHAHRLEDEITSVQIFIKAWKRLMNYGRLGIFWSNVNESRKFAVNVASAVRGITSVFVSEKKNEADWRGEYTGGMTSTLGREMVFFKNGDPVQWDAVYRTKMVIVDMNGEIDSEVLTRLYNYAGKVLIISHDPFMDFKTHNVIAPLVYGLICYSINDFASWEKWDYCILAGVNEAIADGLADLTDKRIKRVVTN